MTWWSIDPGQVHVGVAEWDGKNLVEAYETSPLAFVRDFSVRELDIAVIEAFTLSGAHYGREKAKQAQDTLKLIGFVENWSILFNFSFFEQQPAVRHVAQRSPYWAKTIAQFPLGGNSHVRSAVAHGVYFLNFVEAGKKVRDA